MKSLTAIIEKHSLLEVQGDGQALKHRLQGIGRIVSNAEAPRLAFALAEASEIAKGRIRKPRSWALQVLAIHYNTEPKDIEKCISRDIRSGRRRR